MAKRKGPTALTTRAARWVALAFVFVVAALVALLTGWLIAAPADAAGGTIQVTTTADANTAGGGCTGAPTACTLRDAINKANTLTSDSSGAVVINLIDGTYNLSGALGQLPFIGSSTNHNTTIVGQSGNRANVVVHGDGAHIIFENATIGTAANPQTLTVQDLTLTNGSADAANFGGGAINFAPSVTADALNITNSVLSSNTALNDGGGAVNFNGDGVGSLNITNSLFDTNTSTAAAGGQASGGAVNAAGAHAVSITGTTFSNNTATNPGGGGLGNGGGVWLGDSLNAPTYTITKSTFLNNKADGGVGGAVGNFAGTLTLTFNRIVGNTTPNGGSAPGAGITGGGLITATNDWWGTNSPAGQVSSSGVTFDPFIVLTFKSSPTSVKVNQPTTLTADMSKDNHGNGAALSGNLDVLSGLPVTFGAPTFGTLSGSATSLNSSAQATSTFTAGAVVGTGSDTVTVDGVSVAANTFPVSAASDPGAESITTAFPHNFATGNQVTVAGVGVSGYNGTFLILSTPSPTSFTYTSGIGGLANSSGGTASIGIVVQDDTTTAETSSPNPSRFGQSVTFTATVTPVHAGSGTPSGGVAFQEGSTVLGAGALNGSGVATFTTSSLPVGTHTVVANYTGSPFYTGSSTNASQEVDKADTSMTVTSSQNPSTPGQNVTFTATVSAVAPGAGTPTGTVSFFDNGGPLGTGNLNASGVATFSTTALTVGSHPITASYPGDASFNGVGPTAMTGNPQVVQKIDTTTAVTSSANPSVFGQSVTFTATVTPASGTAKPTGTVTFFDNNTTIGTGNLDASGVATFTPSTPLSVGSHPITTTYPGDSTFNPSNGTLVGTNQVVNAADSTTTVTSSKNPSGFGDNVTFTATVTANPPGSGTPTGTVQFVVDGTTSGSPVTLSGGTASLSTSALGLGSHTIDANYNGHGNFNSSSGSLVQVVKSATSTALVSSPNPSVFGQTVTFTATVTSGAGTPTGTVTFLDNGTPIGAQGLDPSGIANFSTSSLSVGNHVVTASYGGDGTYAPSTGSLPGGQQVVDKANSSMTLTSSLNPSTFGDNVTFTATVGAVAPGAGTPTGTVTFNDGGIPIGSQTLSNGIATLNTATLTAGPHTITADYSGDGNLNGVTGQQMVGNPQVVTPQGTSTLVIANPPTSAFGQSVTFTATVSPQSSGIPTGTVTFSENGIPATTQPLSGGSAAFSTSSLPAGLHTILATYNGDGNFSTSMGTAGETVFQANTTTTVTSSANPSVAGQPVTFTATVTANPPGAGTPTGNVTFLGNGSLIGVAPLDASGVATSPPTAFPAGFPAITANYSGDGNFVSSTGGFAQTVTPANTTTSVTSSLNPSTFGQPVTFTVVVSPVSPGAGTPTGTVLFTEVPDGNTASNVLTNGLVSFTPPTLSPGLHQIIASYVGDPNYNGSTGTLAAGQTVNRADTMTSVTGSPNPSLPNQLVTFTATVTSPAGTPTSGPVTFTDSVSGPLGTVPLSGSNVAILPTSALSPGTHTITAAYGGDTTFAPSSNTTTQVVSSADLAVTKTGPATAAPGTNATYTVTVANIGAVGADNVTLTDAPPVGTTWVSVAQTAGPAFTCNAPAPGSNTPLTCTITTLANNASATFALVLRITPGTTGTVQNTASATTTTFDQDPNNNSGSATTTIGCDHNVTGNVSTLKLTDGRTWCLSGVTSTGPIVVGKGTSVVLTNSTVAGTFTARSPASITICGSQLKGASISKATGFVLIGDPVDDGCAGNTFSKSVVLNKDTGGAEVSHNFINGNLTLKDLSGSGPFPDDVQPEVEANTVGHVLTCDSAVNGGQPNIVSGTTIGAC